MLSLRCHTLLFLSHPSSHIVWLYLVWKGTTQVMNTRRHGLLCTILEVGQHKWNIGIDCYQGFPISLFWLLHRLVTKFQREGRGKETNRQEVAQLWSWLLRPVLRNWYISYPFYSISESSYLSHMEYLKKQCRRFCGHL